MENGRRASWIWSVEILKQNLKNSKLATRSKLQKYSKVESMCGTYRPKSLHFLSLICFEPWVQLNIWSNRVWYSLFKSVMVRHSRESRIKLAKNQGKSHASLVQKWRENHGIFYKITSNHREKHKEHESSQNWLEISPFSIPGNLRWENCFTTDNDAIRNYEFLCTWYQ